MSECVCMGEVEGQIVVFFKGVCLVECERGRRADRQISKGVCVYVRMCVCVRVRMCVCACVLVRSGRMLHFRGVLSAGS